MLVILVLSYSQVIAAHPDGGGAYAVAKRNLGRMPALLAAASLVVDYVLTVAVSLAAGAASLASVFPGLSHDLLAGLPDRARAADRGQHVRDHRVRQGAGAAVRGVHREHVRGPRSSDRFTRTPSPRSAPPMSLHATEAIGIVLLLKAFAAGCSAVTGVEAIANGVPAFRNRACGPRSEPRSRWGRCWR